MYASRTYRGAGSNADSLIVGISDTGHFTAICVEFDLAGPYLGTRALSMRLSANTANDARSTGDILKAARGYAETHFGLGKTSAIQAAGIPRPLDPFDPLVGYRHLRDQDAGRGPAGTCDLTFLPVEDAHAQLTGSALRQASLAVLNGDADMFQEHVFTAVTPDFGHHWETSDLAGIRRALIGHGYDLDATTRLFSADGCEEAATLLWYAEPGPKGEDRRQAAESWPCLTAMIAQSEHLQATVDQRRPLGAELSAIFSGIGKGGLRKLGRIHQTSTEHGPLAEAFVGADDADAIGVVRQRRVALEGSWKTEDAVRWLDRNAAAGGGANAIPDGNDEWNAFTSIYAGMIKPLASHFVGQAWLETIKPPRNSWTQLLEGLGSDLELPYRADRRSLNVAVADAVELCDALARDIILPVILTTIDTMPGYLHIPDARDRFFLAARSVAGEMLVPTSAQQPLRSIATTVRAGLTRLNRLEMIRLPPPAEVDIGQPEPAAQPHPDHARYLKMEWESPWADTDINGVTISFLTSKRAMQAEGKTMKHCIGGRGYSHRCWKGEGIAAHLEDESSAQATAFINFCDRDTRRPVCREINGPRNQRGYMAREGLALRRALSRFLKLAGGAVCEVEENPRRTDFEEWTKSAAAREVLTPWQVGLDPTAAESLRIWEQAMERPLFHETGNIDALWDVWTEILPAPASRASSAQAAVWRLPSAQILLRDMSPAVHEQMILESQERAPQPRVAAEPVATGPSGP
ncbi:MAG: hypothetical protein OXD33_00850 [Rhodobacteraceae bacterium]|nr:hypothetical protein [Paracoccaceae bacterium]